MSSDFQHKLGLLPVLVPVIILAFALHELAHAVVANTLGDDTAKRAGRLTLNPLKHLDPIGSGMLLVTYLLLPFPIGWASTPMNPSKLKHLQRDSALIAVAGPLTNLLMAIVAVGALVHIALLRNGGYAGDVFNAVASINIALFIFNMLPIPGLDGSRVIGVFMNKSTYKAWLGLDRYMMLGVIVILYLTQGQNDDFFTQMFNFTGDMILRLVGGSDFGFG